MKAGACMQRRITSTIWSIGGDIIEGDEERGKDSAGRQQLMKKHYHHTNTSKITSFPHPKVTCDEATDVN